MRTIKLMVVAMLAATALMFVATCNSADVFAVKEAVDEDYEHYVADVSVGRVGEVSEYNHDYIFRRSLYRGLWECYKDSSKTKVNLPSGSDAVASLVRNQGMTIFDNEKSFNIPTSFSYGKDTRHTINCFDGKNEENDLMVQLSNTTGKTNILEIPVNGETTLTPDRDGYYDMMRYEKSYSEVSYDEDTCWYFNIGSAKTNELCVSIEDTAIKSITSKGEPSEISHPEGPFRFTLNAYHKGQFAGFTKLAEMEEDGSEIYVILEQRDGDSWYMTGSSIFANINDTNRNDISTAIMELWEELKYRAIDMYNGSITSGLYLSGNVELVSPDDEHDREKRMDGYSKVDFGNTNIALVPAVSYFQGIQFSSEELQSNGLQAEVTSGWTKSFDETELYYIYTSYLQHNFTDSGLPFKINYDFCYDVDRGEQYIQVVVQNEGEDKRLKWCYMNKRDDNSNNDDNFNDYLKSYRSTDLMVDGDMSNSVNNALDLVTKIRGLGGNIDISKLLANMMINPREEEPTQEPTQQQVGEGTCMSTGAGGSLGWILCSTLDFLSGAVADIYNNHVKDLLEIDPVLFSTTRQDNDGNMTGVEYAWGIFRNFANTLFIVLFLVIIFSQLTGFGIDNYGIKKILPKLIIAAVLINLSYLICQILVDLSNILGNSLQSLFDGIADNFTFSLKIGDGESGYMKPITQANLSGGPGALVSIGLIAVVVSGIFAVIHNPAILLSLLVAVFGAVIAVFFLYLLLTAREAAVVVLTVISPLAFVCFILPNTKKLFDKWVKFMQGLLLVYPIAGLLVGGGNFVSKLILTTGAGDGGFGTALAGMVVGIVPIFFIPSVLKGSFAAMGKVGATLSGLGNKARGVATGRMRNAETYKRAQELGAERRATWRAGLKRKADGSYEEKKVGKIGRMMRGGKRAMADSRTQAIAAREKRQRTDSMLGAGFGAYQIAQSKKFDSEEVANYMTQINDKTRNGEDEEALFALYDQYTNGPNKNKAAAVAVARIAGRRKDTAAAFMSKKFNDISKYSPEIAQSVAKEIATGENSRMYMESTPLQFEYAAQLNRAKYDSNTKTFDTGKTDANGKPITISSQYSGWANNTDNVHAALDKYVTDSRQLAGMKGSALKELQNLMSSGVVSDADKARINTLATQMIENQDKMPLDYTKGAEYAALTGGAYKFDAKTQKFVRLSPPATTASTSVPTQASDAASTSIPVSARQASDTKSIPAPAPTQQTSGTKSMSAQDSDLAIPHDTGKQYVNEDNQNDILEL